MTFTGHLMIGCIFCGVAPAKVDSDLFEGFLDVLPGSQSRVESLTLSDAVSAAHYTILYLDFFVNKIKQKQNFNYTSDGRICTVLLTTIQIHQDSGCHSKEPHLRKRGRVVCGLNSLTRLTTCVNVVWTGI